VLRRYLIFDNKLLVPEFLKIFHNWRIGGSEHLRRKKNTIKELPIPLCGKPQRIARFHERTKFLKFFWWFQKFGKIFHQKN
jgi:hypothetical protein